MTSPLPAHRHTSQRVWGAAAPQTRAKPSFFGQKPAAKNEKNIFGVLIKRKNGIHSV